MSAPAVNETSRILVDTAERFLADRITPDALLRADGGEWLGGVWAELEDLGLPLALVPEEAGGFGVDMVDALGLVRIAGASAAPLPLAETMLACWLLARAGLELPGGPLSVAPVLPADRLELTRDGDGWRLTGTARRVPWGRVAAAVAVTVEQGGVTRVLRVDAGGWTVETGTNAAGEPRDTLRFDARLGRDRVAAAPENVDARALRALGATLRSLALAGAVDRVLALAVQYAGERVQFGRALGKFQAIQQSLAVLAGQAAAAGAAADAAAEAVANAANGLLLLPIAAAKVRCGEAAGIAASIAHQVHGAIGFTHEHTLHHFTRRLWAWRDEFGNEAAWSRILGREVVAAGADGLWPLVTAAAPSDEATEALRAEVRGFLKTELADRPARLRAESWSGFDAGFSRAMGARGWIAMTWPEQYGGHQRSALERYVVLEEMLAAGAPVAAHWIADRQSGPLILKNGTEEQRRSILPRVAAGDCYFCIGMSEPDSGSDLAAVRTRAVPVPESQGGQGGGWRVNGTKLWTTHAHHAHYMILFCRTDGGAESRQDGTSQFLVDLATPGITVRPILDLTGAHHFNEVSFEDVFLPADALIGRRGDGWAQVMSELAYERSGPERFLSSMALLIELVRVLGDAPPERAVVAVGRLVAHLLVLRRMSRAVAGLLEKGENPSQQAALVKDLGALFEQEIPETARQLVDEEPDLGAGPEFPAVLAKLMMNAPSFSLRGGTREILRGIIARGLGLR